MNRAAKRGHQQLRRLVVVRFMIDRQTAFGGLFDEKLKIIAHVPGGVRIRIMKRHDDRYEAAVRANLFR